MTKRLITFLQNNLYWLFPLVIFILLLARNPFSTRTLIPNFEPFPDTFHYITPIRCWLAGEGWTICREGRSLPPSVPPFYSYTLLPFIAVNNDPRMFYFANIVLSVLGFGLLWKVLQQIKVSKVISTLALLLYVTNFYVFWFPTLAMSEVLLLPIFLASLLMLLLPITKRNLVVAGLLTFSFYLTKYAAAPLVVVFGLGYGLKIMVHAWQLPKKRLSTFFQNSLFYVIPLLLIFFVFVGVSVFRSLLMIIVSVVPSNTVAEVASESAVKKSDFFSGAYFIDHFTVYLRALFGHSITTLWETIPLVPRWMGILGMAGLVIGLFTRKARLLSLTIVGMILLQYAFMATFSTTDGRYIIIIIPALIIGLVLLLQQIHRVAQYFFKARYFELLVLVGIFWYLIANALFLKYHVMLNLRYSETPWWYLSIQQLESLYSQPTQVTEDRPVLITAIPVYLFDFYAPHTYQLVPLSYDLDFRDEKDILFGPADYTDLITLYNNYLVEGKTVYLTNYGIGNVVQRQQDYQTIQEYFELELVQEGCHSLCNVWLVKPQVK